MLVANGVGRDDRAGAQADEQEGGQAEAKNALLKVHGVRFR
jgi:hypothetical protein